MTVSSTVRTAGPYVGTGSVSVYPFAFKVFQDEDVVAQVTDTSGAVAVLTLDSDYTVLLNADQDSNPGGSITLATPLVLSYLLNLESDVEQLQLTALENAGGFFPEVIEDAFDRAVILIQQQQVELDLSLKFPLGDQFNVQLPSSTLRAGLLLGFDSSGVPIAVAPVAGTATALATLLAGSAGATFVGFSQTSTFAVGTLGFKAQRDGISATDTPFNAKGDGITDDTTAINAAISRAIATGQKWVYLPPGTYPVSGQLNITAGVALIGAGRNCTTITWASKTLTAISIATVDQCIVRGICFAAPMNCTAGGAISLTGSVGSPNAFSEVTDCEFSNGYVQFATVNAYAFKNDGNYFSGAVSAALIVQNVVVPDAGDSEISNFTISNLGAGAIGILQTSSGGLRISNGKILGGTQGIALNLLAGDATSILLIRDVSIELCTSAAITLLVGAGASFALVTIDGYSLSQVPIGINIPGNGGTVRLSNLTIGAGVISLTAAGTQGIIVNDVANFTIAPTTIIGNGGTPTGIVVGGFSVQGRIYPGSIQGCATKISNGSGTTVIVAEDIQAGTHAVTCSTAQGGLFYGSAAVTFPLAFDSAPAPFPCNPGTVAGGVNAWPSAVTAAGFTMNVISTTNGGAGNANFAATGVL